MARAELAAAAAKAVAAHSMSTSDESACSCGMWLGLRSEGPIDMQHEEHVGWEVVRAVTPLIIAATLQEAADMLAKPPYLGRTRRDDAELLRSTARDVWQEAQGG